MTKRPKDAKYRRLLARDSVIYYQLKAAGRE
jgi:hypothetical protein